MICRQVRIWKILAVAIGQPSFLIIVICTQIIFIHILNRISGVSALLFNNCHLYTDNLHPYTQPHFRRLLVYVPDTKASVPALLFRLPGSQPPVFNNCHLYTDNLHPYTQPHFRRLLVYVPDTKASVPALLFRLPGSQPPDPYLYGSDMHEKNPGCSRTKEYFFLYHSDFPDI